MQEDVRDQLSKHLRRAAMAIVASGVMAAAIGSANPSNNLVLVPPTDLPASARQTGARLATFDVTGPVHIRVKGRSLETLQGLTLRGPITHRANDEFTVTGQAAKVLPARDYQVVDTVNLHELNRVFDVKQVRAEMTKANTGTTFMLTENGLYVIRRPAVESIHQLMMSPPN